MIADWEADGFAAPSESFVATGNEVVLRTYNKAASANLAAAEAFVPSAGPAGAGARQPYDRATLVRRKAHGASARDGRCFFVPSFGQLAGPIRNGTVHSQDWTGAYLDRHLNAFIWGNDYATVGFFLLAAGTRYRIGLIGQGVHRLEQWVAGSPTVEQNWAAPDARVSTEFRQVRIDGAARPPVLLLEHNILGLPAMDSRPH